MKLPRKTVGHCVICSWFRHADQGTPRPKTLRTQGWSQTQNFTEDRDPASDLYRASYMGSTEKEPSILLYKDLEATLCLKEILAHFVKYASQTTPQGGRNCDCAERAYCFNAELAFPQQTLGPRGLFQILFLSLCYYFLLPLKWKGKSDRWYKGS